MKLSTRGRYGVRAMLELALGEERRPLSLKKLAEHQEISAKYLEQLLIPLKAAGLVQSVRGASGGYLLARDPKTISLFEIVRILEGPVTVVECVDNPELCQRQANCSVRLVWEEMSQMIADFLENVNLAQLAERHQEQDRLCRQARAV